MNNFIDRYQNFINTNSIAKKINAFCNSYLFMFIIGFLVVISNVFAIELFCFPIISLLGVVTLLFSKDGKPLISIILLFLMSISYKNGLSYNPNFDIPNIFDKTWVIVYSAILIGIVPLTAIFNFVVFRQYKLAFKKSLMFLPGLIALGVAYVLGGIGPKYTPNNLLFSLSNILMIIGLIFLILSPIFGKLMQLAVSRKREFLADATAVQFTRNPDGLISALQKISGDPNQLKVANNATENMYIASPFRNKKKSSNLWSTHPSIEDRVEALRNLK